jgi:gluconolactonase
LRTILNENNYKEIMEKWSLFTCILLSTSCFAGCDGGSRDVIAPGATLEKLADGFAFTEGPAADRDGNVYFTDQPNDRILVYTTGGELRTFREGTGRANGLSFDREGHLLSCSDMDNQIWKFDSGGGYSVLLPGYDGKLFNGPNDLWVSPSGAIYFTDPLYVRDYWLRDPQMQQAGQHVYFCGPDGNGLRCVEDGLVQPNGIVGTADGKRLYVADIGDGKTWVYDIRPDGLLTEKTLFANLGSDGMTMDAQGNVYLTGDGVTVFNPAGDRIAHIAVPEPWTANVCFGGEDGKTLFVTASGSLYSLRMRVAGVR